MTENWELAAVRAQLKGILKQRRLGYREVAERMGVSEITIKRFFTSADLSFVRLQEVCRSLDLSALELLALVGKGRERVFQLTEKQESQLAKNETLYEFFVRLLKYRSLRRVTAGGRFRGENIPRLLRELNALDLIELPIGDHVPVKGAGTLTWRKGGPLQKKFMRARHERYLSLFEGELGGEGAYLASSQRHLRPETLAEMRRDLEYVVQKYRDRAYLEETTCAEGDLVGVVWLMGLAKFAHL